MDPAKLAKLQAQAASNRIGGKGTVRRKIVRKSKPSNTQDDKKLQGALKKLNVQPITGVEEVNMFREDGNVLHFSAPKGMTITVSDFVAWGVCQLVLVKQCTLRLLRIRLRYTARGQVKELTELVPGILNQLGPDSLASLRKLAESYQAIQQGQQRAGAGAAEDDDDDVPDLVENFDVEEQKKDNTLEELN
ncbi:putative transcription factor BTF3a [Russula emetica]|nr:putative transcription factor BTF3a [Russula emetica]